MAIGTSVIAAPATDYPRKPVRVIVALAPGGAVSAVSRIFADRLGKELGKTFIVDHRGGGETLIGTAAAAAAPGDGYTLLVASPAFAVNHTLMPDRGYDTIKDFTPVSGLVQTAWLLVAHPQMPVRNLKEFVAYSKANPDKVNLSSASSIGVLMYELLNDATGVKFTVVNYKGQGPATTDLLSGVVQGTLTTATNIEQYIKAGRLKALATAGDKRNPLFPTLPTFAEQGVNGFVAQSWYTLLAPKNTPPDIVAKLNAAVRKIQNDPEVKTLLAKLGFETYQTTVPAIQTQLSAEILRYGQLVKKSGLAKHGAAR
ncbi:MAG: tripartite tricarboxylate transporter substrate binding protein [Pseudomonadota bacterium]